MKRTLSFLLPAAAMLLAACGGANDRPSFPDFQEMADPAAAFADWSAAGDTPCASFVTTDRRFGKSQLPDVEPRTACRLTAWRGERVSAQLLVWSAQPVERLVCTAGVLTSDEGRLPESAVRTRFVRYVMSDEFACGCCKRKPQDFAAVLTADMLDERPSMALEACTVRPVWITVDVPQDAAPGLYRTPVTVACDGDEQRLELAVEVTGRTLPAPSEWRYHLDLWQHPAAVARVEGTEMWSDAHFEALRPVMKPLADAGQKVVTATLNKDPWNNQCYDAYADATLTRIPPHVDRPDCISVSGLDSICKLIRTELEKVDTTIMVQVKSNDTVEVMTTYLSDFSRNTLYRAKADAPGLRTGFRGREVALIELRSLCIPNEGTAYLLDLLSRMTNENSVSTNDNGVTQTVEARQGVALNAVVEIKPRVMLRPFRTFLEVEQPESEFLLRVDPDEGIGFFEADGGIWKLEAKKNIADYFLKNMGDLIDAGKVVVMQ